MKKALMYGALLLTVFPASYVSAQGNVKEVPCTTGYNNRGICDRCKLFNFNEGLRCNFHGPDVRLRIDDCVENREGVMRPGRGAGDSCKNYQLEDDILHAECRTGAGNYLATSINIGDVFVARIPADFFDSSVVCNDPATDVMVSDDALEDVTLSNDAPENVTLPNDTLKKVKGGPASIDMQSIRSHRR